MPLRPALATCLALLPLSPSLAADMPGSRAHFPAATGQTMPAERNLRLTQRAQVPASADLALLEAETARCAQENPDDDTCYDLLMAQARALSDGGRHAEAVQSAKVARASVLDFYNWVDDAYADVIGGAEFQQASPEAIDPDFPRIAALRRKMWADSAEAALVYAEAAEAEGDLFSAAEGFSAYWSINTEYVKDPVKAEHALAMGLRGGEIYLTAGAADRAESLLGYTFTETENSFGRDHPTVVAMLILRAQAHSAMGKYAEAEAMFADARARAERTGEAILRADADAAYARHLLLVDRAREALDLQREVVLRLESAKAPAARMARAYLDFAEVSAGEEALRLGARAVELHAQSYGAEHLATGRARIAIAGLLDRQGYADDAERERAEGIEILSRRLSVLHPEIALAKLRQAENLLLKDRCEEVTRLAGYALDSFIYVAGDGRTAYTQAMHPNTARAQFLLGMCQFSTDIAKAIERLEQAAKIQRTVLVPTHPERMQTEMALGLIARARGDFGAALGLLRGVASAAGERVRSYAGFDPEAMRELRAFAPVYTAIVQTAWVAGARR